MTKALNKAIMKWSRFRNKFLEEKTFDARVAYNKQRNYYVNLLRRTKKTYLANINIDLVTDNQKKLENCQTNSL